MALLGASHFCVTILVQQFSVLHALSKAFFAQHFVEPKRFYFSAFMKILFRFFLKFPISYEVSSII